MHPTRTDASPPPPHADTFPGHTPLAPVEWDGEGRVSRWSPQAEALFGWREEEVLGKRMTEWPFVHPDDLASVVGRTSRMAAGRDRQNLSANRNLTRDGRVLYCEWYNTALVDGEGRATAQLSLVLDVTARVRAREEAEAARAAAEHAADRTRRLQALTAALSQALTPAQVARAVMDQGVAALGADAAVMVLRSADGEHLDLVASRGFAEDRVRGWERFPLSAPVPIADAARNGELVVLGSREERAARYPYLAAHLTEHAVSISVPLAVEGETIGAMGLNFLAAMEIGADDRDFLEALARQSAQAIRRSTLYAASRSARREAERLGDRLRLALDAADVGTWDFDPVSGALAWDDRCKAVFGLAAGAEVDHAAFLAGLHPDDRGATDARVRAALDPAGAGEFDTEYRVVRPDGTTRWALARGRAVFEEAAGGRRAVRFIGTIVDVTERREAHAERDRLLAELERERGQLEVLAEDRARLYEEALAASRAKTGFLATMSHELRTPLNAVIGYADLLLLGIPAALPPGARTQVERIYRASRHLLSIIEEILTFSRIEAGREPVSAEPVDLAELVREVCAIAEPLAAEKRVRFVAGEPSVPGPLVTDGRKLRQILINLVGNAVKFTEAGEVALSVEEGDGTVALRVTDTGIGIAPEDLERIWEPFRQVDQGTTRKEGGTGLGLTVSRELARMVGGEILVESAPGAGSTFTVRLPAAWGEPG